MNVKITSEYYDIKYSIWYKIKLCVVYIICGAMVFPVMWPAMTGNYYVNFYIYLVFEIVALLSIIFVVMVVISKYALAVNRRFSIQDSTLVIEGRRVSKSGRIACVISDIRSIRISTERDVLGKYYAVRLSFYEGVQWDMKIFRKLTEAQSLKGWLDEKLLPMIHVREEQ